MKIQLSSSPSMTLSDSIWFAQVLLEFAHHHERQRNRPVLYSVADETNDSSNSIPNRRGDDYLWVWRLGSDVQCTPLFLPSPAQGNCVSGKKNVGVNKPKYITYAAASIMMITSTGKCCQGYIYVGTPGARHVCLASS